MRDCGLIAEYASPKPIGRGANKIVYLYNVPGGTRSVVKVHLGINPMRCPSLPNERRQVDLAERYFKGFTVKTEVREGGNDAFCTVMDYVEGQAVDTHNIVDDRAIQSGLEELVRKNLELVRNEGYSIDFIGLGGLLSLIRYHLNRCQPIIMANVLINPLNEGRPVLVDYDLLSTRRRHDWNTHLVDQAILMGNSWVLNNWFNTPCPNLAKG